MNEAAATTGPTTAFRRLGRYTILEDLAKGGMAEVFIAKRDGSSDLCVLKKLLGSLDGHDTAPLRLYREAHVVSYLRHPNLAQVLAASEEEGSFTIALELVVGADLETMVHRLWEQGRMLPYQLTIPVAIGALAGLAHAHAAAGPDGRPLELVHRDLSPRNIMVSVSGQAKVIDFGLARGKVGDFLTQPGVVLGTLRYLSPEQAVAEPVDARSDVYSFSVLLHELLTASYVVKSGKPIEVLHSVINDSFPLVNELNTHLPKALGAVIAKGLVKDRTQRWQTAEEYRRALVASAGELADTRSELIGSFVDTLCPSARVRAARLARLAAREQGEEVQEEPQKTRTGYLPGPSGPPPVVSSDGVVVPVDLAPPSAEATLVRTRTHLERAALNNIQASAFRLPEVIRVGRRSVPPEPKRRSARREIPWTAISILLAGLLIGFGLVFNALMVSRRPVIFAPPVSPLPPPVIGTSAPRIESPPVAPLSVEVEPPASDPKPNPQRKSIPKTQPVKSEAESGQAPSVKKSPAFRDQLAALRKQIEEGDENTPAGPLVEAMIGLHKRLKAEGALKKDLPLLNLELERQAGNQLSPGTQKTLRKGLDVLGAALVEGPLEEGSK